MTGTSSQPPDPCEGSSFAEYLECAKKVLGEVASRITTGGEWDNLFEQRVQTIEPKSRTPEKLALFLATSMQEVGHAAEAALVSYALAVHLLRTQRESRTLLYEALMIHEESLPNLGPREQYFLDGLKEFITKK